MALMNPTHNPAVLGAHTLSNPTGKAVQHPDMQCHPPPRLTVTCRSQISAIEMDSFLYQRWDVLVDCWFMMPRNSHLKQEGSDHICSFNNGTVDIQGCL